MMRGRERAPLVGAVLAGLLVAGCGGGAPAPSSVSPPAAGATAPAPAAAPAAAAAVPAATAAMQTPRPLTAVAVHNFARTVSTAIIGYAAERGLAREEGLDVTLQEADAAIGIQLLATNQIQFSTSVGSAVPAAIRNVPIKTVFVTSDRPSWWMYAHPSIQSVADLRGKRVGVATPGAIVSIVPRLIVERHGVNPDDVAWVNVATPQRLGALQAGAVDAAILSTPFNLHAARAGLHLLFASQDEGIRLTTEGLATGDDFLRDRPAAVRQMLRASLRALRALRDDPAAATDFIARFTDVEADEARQLYDLVHPTWATTGTTDAATLRQSIDIMKIAAEVDGPVAESQVYDLRLAQEVAAELGAR